MAGRAGPWLLTSLLLLLLGAAGALVWSGSRPPGAPGLPFRRVRTQPTAGGLSASARSAFPNARPGVKYVGDQACARCHAEISESYRKHPMGRSLAPVEQAALPPVPSGSDVLFVAQGLEYTMESRGAALIHGEVRRDGAGRVVGRGEGEVRYVIGSGEQALAFVVERGDGYLFESPITWYAGGKGWGLSPGYEADNPHFERLVKTPCLFCHGNQFHHVEGTENRYRRPIFDGHAIGCERCHGPGELHVHRPETPGGGPANIINPAVLEPALREAVCQQCHLQGDIRVVRAGRSLTDFRPGLPLHEVESVFVKADRFARRRFFGQVEQMHESRCYQASGGRLGCISCHDPHKLPDPAAKDAYYRERCLECHADRGCRLPAPLRQARPRGNACTECHMPRAGSGQIPHVATTVHLIPRFADQPAPAAAAAAASAPAEHDVPLVLFDLDLRRQEDRVQLGRDLGIALVESAGDLPGLSTGVAHRKALPLIEAALRANPADPAALEAQAKALWRLGRRAEALEALRAAIAEAPEREATLAVLGAQAAQLGRHDEALEAMRRAVAINPWRAEYHKLLALLHSQRADWSAAEAAARACLALDPWAHEAGMLRVQALIRGGKLAEARRAFQVLLENDPPNREAAEAWFARTMPPDGR